MSTSDQVLRRPASPRLTLSRRPYRLLLTSHVAASAAVLGIDVTLLLLAVTGLDVVDPATVYPAMHTVARWGLAPLAVLALLTGLMVAAAGPYGLFRYWWVTVKLAITSVLTTLVLFVAVPGFGRAADAATAAGTGASVEDAQRVLFTVVPALGLTLLLVNVTLAIYKPRRRVRRSGPDPEGR